MPLNTAKSREYRRPTINYMAGLVALPRAGGRIRALMLRLS